MVALHLSRAYNYYYYYYYYCCYCYYYDASVRAQVPKFDNELRLCIRHEEYSDGHGLFLHGFESGCRAQGVLQIGDEFIWVNGVDVQGCPLEKLLMALEGTWCFI